MFIMLIMNIISFDFPLEFAVISGQICAVSGQVCAVSGQVCELREYFTVSFLFSFLVS